MSMAAPAELAEMYSPAAATASELTEDMDGFLDNTESEYISDDEEIDQMETIEELQEALRGKCGQIKNLRKQLGVAKGLLSRTKASNKMLNKELKDVMYEIMRINEQNKGLEQALQMFEASRGK